MARAKLALSTRFRRGRPRWRRGENPRARILGQSCVRQWAPGVLGRGQPMSADLVRLIELAESFPRQRILVLADLVADEFVSGEITRVSREAPVLILRHAETRLAPGGGANAANNLADLGAQVHLVGAVGDDAAGRGLVKYFREKKVSVSGLSVARGWTTPTKTRYLAGFTHTARQQV